MTDRDDTGQPDILRRNLFGGIALAMLMPQPLGAAQVAGRLAGLDAMALHSLLRGLALLELLGDPVIDEDAAALLEQIERRLRGDFQLLDEALSRAMRSHEEIILALEALRTAIERGEALSSEDEAIKTALVMGRSYPSFERKSATYSELVSSGRLHLVRSDSLRKALALYNERIDNSLYNIQQIREPMNQDLIFLAQYAELTPITAGSVGIQAALSYDIAAMANDLEFRRRLGVLIVFQTWTYSNLANQRKAIDAVLQAMEPK